MWELPAIYADCAEWRGDFGRAVALYAESLTWTSTTGEAHQMLMDIRSIATGLARLGRHEAALEVYELLQLELRRTGRVGVVQEWYQSLEDAIAVARASVPSDSVQRVAACAAEVPVTGRAARVIELAQAAP